MSDKLLTRETLLDVLSGLRQKGAAVVFTNGCFDLLHVGHIRYLRQARAEGDLLVVGLNTDRSVRELKGESRPFVPQEERAELLGALTMIDYIVLFDEPTPLELIKRVQPDVLVKGGDWRREEIVGADEVKSAGGKVVVIPEVPGRSTSALLEKIVKRARSEIEI